MPAARRLRLPAKLTVPSPGSAVHRERLFKAIDQARSGPVVWVDAPAGSGKTTLLADYVQMRKVPAIWHRLDASDGDPATFFALLRESAQTLDRRVDLPLLTPEYFAGLDVFTRNFFRTLFRASPEGLLLVFDDYHEIAPDSPVHALLPQAMEDVPAGVCLVVASRAGPPPEMARLRARPGFTRLGWDAMRFTEAEWSQVARSRTGPGAAMERIMAFYGKAQGWIAGLILLMEQSGPEDASDPLSPECGNELIFEYFANELLARAGTERGEFLLRTALSPGLTAADAAELSGMPDAANILEDLERRNFFALRRRQGKAWLYEYHPLFRAFLLERGRRALDKAELRRLRRLSAELLARRGELEQALDLLMEAGDWDRAGEMALQLSPGMLAAGRHQPLMARLESFPEATRQARPWLDYQLGNCYMSADFSRARACFQAAHEGFARLEGLDEADGLYLSLSGIIDSVVYEWASFQPLDPWLTRLSELRGRGLGFSSRDIEIRVATSAVVGLMYRDSASPDLPVWVDRLEHLLLTDPEPAAQLASFAFLAHYHAWFSGDHCRAVVLVESLEKTVKEKTLPPLARIVWHALLTDHHWIKGDFHTSLATARRGLEIAQETGVHLWDTMVLLQKAWSALALGDEAEMDATVAVLKEYLGAGLYRLLYQQFAFMRATLAGDTQRMLDHAQINLDLARQGAFPWAEAMAQVFIAKARVVRGEFPQAESALKETGQDRFSATAIPSLHLAMLEVRAQLAMARSGQDQAGRLQDYFGERKRLERCGTTTWDHPTISAMCVKALERDIEADYVRGLVRRWGYVPKEPPIHLDDWPWKLRIHTLGRFTVEVDGRELVFGGKAQSRPLDLLKALAALGGQDVSQEKLCDLLWPESEGDAAQRALEVNLHRLRKLLGVDNVLVRREGRISLDPGLCWIDIRALEKLARRCGGGGRDTDIVGTARKALNLLMGQLLPNDDAPWALALRRDLTSRHALCLMDMARGLDSAAKPALAAECRSRADQLGNPSPGLIS